MTLYREPCVVCGEAFHEEMGAYLVGQEHVRTCGEQRCGAELMKLALLKAEVAEDEPPEYSLVVLRKGRPPGEQNT